MSYILDSPVPFRTLSAGGGGDGGDQGWSHALGFWVGGSLSGGSPMDIYTFLNFISGTTETFSSGGIVYNRIVPLRHPYLTNMLLTRVRWDFTGPPLDAEPGWTDAKVWCEFGVPPYAITGDQPFYTIRTRFGAAYETVPDSAFQFSDGSKLSSDSGLFIPEIGFTVTTYLDPIAVSDTVAAMTGTVNSAIFLGRAIGTIRFDGVETEFTRNASLQSTYVKTFSLNFRPRPWNEVLRKDGAWDVPTSVATGLPKYASADHNLLLY